MIFVKIANAIIVPTIGEVSDLWASKVVFPNAPKVTEVILSYKQDIPINCLKCRPVSLLSSFSKIFEKLAYNRIYICLFKFNLLSPNLFGFQRNVSTSHAISVVFDNL